MRFMSGSVAGSDVFHAIADTTRRAILDLLLHAGEKPVNSLCEQFDMTQPAVSQHLRVLRTAGLVSERRLGRQRLYSLASEPLKEVSEWIEQYERFWQARLDALGDYMDRNP